MNRTFELLRLFAECEKIEGRKKLQKLVHLLKEAGYPFEYRYGYHFHGPFSVELKAEIDSLVSQELVIESKTGDPVGDFIQYDYSASRTLLDWLSKRSPKAAAPPWKDLALLLNQRSAQALEATSTIVYLARAGYETDKLASQFGKLKPHLRADFDESLKLADRILANDDPQVGVGRAPRRRP